MLGYGRIRGSKFGLARRLGALNRIPEARSTVKKAEATLENYAIPTSGLGRQTVFRIRAGIAGANSDFAAIEGAREKALRFAGVAVDEARRAVDVWVDRSNVNLDLNHFNTLSQLSAALERLSTLQLAYANYWAAEQSIAESIRLSGTHQQYASVRIRLLKSVFESRFAQRDFASAVRIGRSIDSAWAEVGYGKAHSARLTDRHFLLRALWATSRMDEAAKELAEWDDLASEADRTNQAPQLRLARGLIALDAGRNEEAAAAFAARYRDISTQYGERHYVTAEARGLLGVALWRSRSVDARAPALPLLKAAVDDLMSPKNADFVENVGIRQALRELIVSAYVDALALTPGEDPTLALPAADWVRGSIVQQALADAAGRAAFDDPRLASLVREEQDARNEVAALRNYLAARKDLVDALPEIAQRARKRTEELELRRTQLQSQLREAYPDFEQLLRPRTMNMAEIARGLTAEQALIVLLPTDKATSTWLVTADRPAVYVRTEWDSGALKSIVQRLRASLDLSQGGHGPSEFDVAGARVVYQSLIAPLREELRGKRQLIIAAGGVLARIPFSVLRADTDGAVARWLIQDFTIAHVPSVSAWMAVRQLSAKSQAREPLAGWGDPQFNTRPNQRAATGLREVLLTRARSEFAADGNTQGSRVIYSQLPPLPETRDELLAIAASLNVDPTKSIYFGARATRASVLELNRSGELARRRVIVFATHGLMADDLPNLNQPALALATTDADGTDPLAPLLKLDDVLTLRLNADWVVLSACNTAADDGRAEEALSGLARGFFYSGARSMLATHWSVESESAKLLTTRTFEHYTANQGAGKAESLRQAMLQVMALPQYAHPSFWAPFVLVGDGGR